MFEIFMLLTGVGLGVTFAPGIKTQTAKLKTQLDNAIKAFNGKQ